ncbi:MAG: EamA family transporter [Humidesulfovibrio sp.]|nr:EamA family transporter [Humidesulfovibrio sp.]
MTGNAKAPAKLVLGLTLAVVLDTATQIVWKSAVSGVPDQPSLALTVAAMLHQPSSLLPGVLVGLLMGGQFLNWMTVLEHADLSYAHAFTSLSYVTVAAFAVLYLGESLDLVQALGIVLILAGVWFVGKSGRVAVKAGA